MLAEQYRFIRIEDLPPYENNAMLHTPQQIEDLADLIDSIGWTIAVVADEKGIIAGHKRVKDAHERLSWASRGFLPTADDVSVRP
jgi:ParB-like chromosome segregation protein Spo0J